MFSWSKHTPEIYQQYLSVLYDVTIPKDWTRDRLLKEGQNRCEALALIPPNQRTFPSVDWSKKDKGWTSAFAGYKRLKKTAQTIIIGDTFWDSPFYLSDLDNSTIAKVVPISSLGRINEAKRDLGCLGLPLTKRVAKWICRFDEIAKPVNSLLTTTGLGLMYTIGKNERGITNWRFIWGVADIAVMYANSELHHSITTKNEVDPIPFSTANLDAVFVSDTPPNNFKFRVEGYMLDTNLNDLVRALNKRNDLGTVEARKAIRKYFQVKKHIWEKEKAYTRYNLNVDKLLNLDVPTIYEEIKS